MTQISGGHLVGKYLKEVERVDTVFCISGGHIEAILDSFTEYRIRAIDVRHEQAAAMMAHAWSVYGQTGGVPRHCRAWVHQCPDRHRERIPG